MFSRHIKKGALLLLFQLLFSYSSYAQEEHYRMESKLTFDHVAIDQRALHVVFTEKFSSYLLDDLEIELQKADGSDFTSLISSVEVTSGMGKIQRGTNYLKVNFTSSLSSSNGQANSNLASYIYILIIKDSKGNKFYKRFVYAP